MSVIFVFDSVTPWNQLGLVVIIQLNLIALNFEDCLCFYLRQQIVW